MGLAIRGGDLCVVGDVVGVRLTTMSTSGCGEKLIDNGRSSVVRFGVEVWGDWSAKLKGD